MSGAGHTGAAEAGRMVEHLFRHQHAPILGALVRQFGPAHLALAEECLQDAFLRALQTWPFHGIPPNPAAWLTLVAKRRALDQLRRPAATATAEPAVPPQALPTLGDDTLELIFLCCHPTLAPDAQLALTLKSVAGLSTAEIARAFFTQEATVAQRIVRAKRAIAEGGLSFDVPFDAHLAPLLDSVCRVLYLMFNEGYSASGGDRLLREDLCQEAIRLVALLTINPATGRPAVHALAALFCLQAARLPARVDDAGDLLTLDVQDRSRGTAACSPASITSASPPAATRSPPGTWKPRSPRCTPPRPASPLRIGPAWRPPMRLCSHSRPRPPCGSPGPSPSAMRSRPPPRWR
ncbi:MAG: hypothetical protein IPJ98_09670 [Bryobacterales bacterium]|nr:hypothetical protein [Bryobacterales bacterium]